ncbi:MAG TPA: sialate O-acetylesterase [Caulobacteraceae bacterium]
MRSQYAGASRLVGLGTVLAAALLSAGTSRAEGSLLAPVFQDHAVLQRGGPIPLWGEAAPGSAVSVTLGGAAAKATADGSGHWMASLPAPAAGGPYELAVEAGGQSQRLSDILVGDVWLCSGQSNMEMPVRRVIDGETEIANSANDRIRLLNVPRASSATPQTAFAAPTPWRLAGPASVGDFSAACFFFGKDMQAATGVPQGLIASSWGGSIIQDWISRPTLTRSGGYGEALEILAQHAAAPQAAEARWQGVMDRWWLRHAPPAPGKPWSAGDFDDSAWPTIRPVSFWEGLGVEALSSFDGQVWFRTTIQVTVAQAKQGAVLWLGPVDDIDSTWINGAFVGGVEGWDTERVYKIAPGVLRPGVNHLAVRVMDTGGGGGMWGAPDKRGLRFADGGFAPVDPVWRYRIAQPLGETGPPPHAPWIPASGLTTLYNGMIAPIGPYGLRGVTWYQGEANVGEPKEYARLLPALIADWRGRFGPDLSFLVVQLANFGPASSHPTDSAWAALREVQRRTVAADPHAGLAVAIDLGERSNIHPTNKQEVGRRLSLQARRLAGEAIVASGPAPLAAHRDGGRVIVSFDSNLVVFGDARPIGFEVCDAGGGCRFADAAVDGSRVVLSVPDAAAVAKVRFGWADSPVSNLYNAKNLPAAPFELPVE